MTYRGIHQWVERYLGKPQICSECDVTDKKRYHWANLSGEYRQDVSDWVRLCVPCHKRYDLNRLGGQNKHSFVLAACKKGHPFSDGNTRWRTRGTNKWRVCLTCQREYFKNYLSRQKVEA